MFREKFQKYVPTYLPPLHQLNLLNFFFLDSYKCTCKVKKYCFHAKTDFEISVITRIKFLKVKKAKTLANGQNGRD